MISTKALRAIARARLRDAQVPLRAGHFDGAFYLCGCAIELALKARMAKHFAEWSAVLDWNPEKRYQATGQSTAQQAADMVTCTKRLLEVL